MIAARLTRRRVRLIALQCLHAGQHHYGSAITFAVLSVALTFALTSSSFTSRLDPDPAGPPPASRIQLPVGYKLAREPVTPRVTYYLYADEADRKLYSDILRSDFTAMSRLGLPDYIGEVHFLRVTTEAEERYAAFLVMEMTGFAGEQGLSFSVRVVDLR